MELTEIAPLILIGFGLSTLIGLISWFLSLAVRTFMEWIGDK